MRYALLAVAVLGACAAPAGGTAAPPRADAAGGASGGDASASSGGSTGSGGASSSPDAGASQDAGASSADAGGVGASDAAGPGCTASIVQLTPWILSSVLQGAKLHLRAQDAAGPQTTWRWTIIRDGDISARVLDALPSQPNEVEVVLDALGRYQVSAVEYPGCAATLEAMTVTASQAALFWVRAVPPPGVAASPSTTSVLVPPGQAIVQHDIDLPLAVPLSLDPVADAGPTGIPAAVPSYVRVELPSAGLRLEGHTGQRGFMVWLAPGMTYQVLVVPDGAFAPISFTGFSTAFPPPLVVDAGMTVSGTVTSSAGPVADARILLRAGDLPSTVGVASAQGTYTLHARGDQLGVTVMPPVGSSLPQARLEAGKIAFQDPATLNFRWNALPAADLPLAVKTRAGIAPASRVAVRLSSLADGLADVGTFSAGSGMGVSAAGFVSIDGLTDATGAVTFKAVPVGSYSLTLTPDAVDGAVTILPVAVPGAAQTIALAVPVKVAGTVTPAALGAGTTVIAIDANADPGRPVPTARIDETGRYELLVDPGPSGGERAYRLFVEPVAARGLPRVPLGQVIVADRDVTVEARTIPAGLTLQGSATLAGKPEGGVLVQVYCVGVSPDCVDLNAATVDRLRPVGEALTTSDGAFALVVPDPATLLRR